MSKWLKNAIFYEIYPTSFMDSDGDGIGDLRGIAAKLDYVASLGCNAIWLNPFYKSPFKDGGYDVSDFFDVDPRFGTLDDFKNLLAEAHRKGIKIIVDLVAGHASEQNPEFLRSAEPERNECSDLFIWNSCVWDLEQPYRLISGRYDRNACYMVNFFSTQPAFNYGFNEITHPKWQMSYQDPRTFAAREYLKKIMFFWLDLGVDGFRVDMADSLVKNDDDKKATMEIWKEISLEVKKAYPESVLVSEWSNPSRSLSCGFDCDFVLDHWDNFFHLLVRSTPESRGVSLLNGGDQPKAYDDLVRRIEEAGKAGGYLGLISGNHDTPRISSFLDETRLRLYYLMMFTLPGVPFLYYGDEIEMKHQNLASKDGGYQRTGDRTPMQWDRSANCGFSETKGELYLPQLNVKTDVASSEADPSSLLNWLKKLIAFRKAEKALTDKAFAMNEPEKGLIVYDRGNLRVLINLGDCPVEIEGKVRFRTETGEAQKNKLYPYQGVVVEKEEK